MATYRQLTDSEESDEFAGPERLDNDAEVFAAIQGYSFEPLRQSCSSTVREIVRKARNEKLDNKTGETIVFILLPKSNLIIYVLTNLHSETIRFSHNYIAKQITLLWRMDLIIVGKVVYLSIDISKSVTKLARVCLRFGESVNKAINLL